MLPFLVVTTAPSKYFISVLQTKLYNGTYINSVSSAIINFSYALKV